MMLRFLKHKKQDQAGDEGDKGGAGGGEPNWRDSLPETLRDSETLKDVADVSSLAQQFVDQSSHLGNSIRVPSKEASPEDWEAFNNKLNEKVPTLMQTPDFDNEESVNAFYDKMGRPETPDGYKVPEIEGANAQRVDMFRGFAHKAGISNKQFGIIMSEVMKVDSEAAANAKALRDEENNKLKAEWGEAYDQRSAQAISLAEQTGAPAALIESMIDGSVNPETLRWMHKMVGIGAEGGEIVTQGEGASDKITPDEARERANEIMKKLTDMRPDDPDYQALVQRRFKYMEMASAA